jgi:uncharacterized protein (TIGR02246 family)
MRPTRHLPALPLLFVALAACNPSTPSADSSAAAPAAATTSTPANDPAMVRAYIDSADADALAAVKAGDIPRWSAWYTDDAVLLNPGAPAARGRTAIEAQMKNMFDGATIESGGFKADDVIVEGDVAIETGSYDWTLKLKDGKVVPDKGKFVTVWRRQADGGWKIIRDINNTDMAPK